jgi:hypothetical protein
VNRICLWSDREGSDETSQPIVLSRSLKDPKVMSITSDLPPLQKVGSFPLFRISKLVVFRNSNRASPLLLQLVLPHILCIGVAPHNKIEVFLFTVVHEILQFLRRRRILRILGKVCIGVAPHNKIEVFLFTVVHEILQFLRRRRILGIIGKVCRTYDQALLYHFLIVLNKNFY